MQKILIVGAGGFIGRNLKEHFEKLEEYEVYAPSRRELDCTDEVSVRTYLEQHPIDIVFHCAVFNPKDDRIKDLPRKLEYDLRMFYNFAKYSSLYRKMIYFGSGAEYDKTKDIIDAREGIFENEIPKNDYGLAKYIIYQQIIKSENIYNFRLFGLFGKYEDWKRTFISGACCKALKNLPITIRQNVYFDYLYVEDFLKIVELLLEKELQYHEYNLVSGKKIDLYSLAQMAKEASGNDVPIYVCKDGLANEYTASNDRLMEELGGYAFTPMEEAVKELYEWYKVREEEIDILSLLYQ